MKKIIGFIICTLLITATGFSVVGTDENREGFNKNYTTSNLEHSPPLTGLFEWPMFRYNLNNSGYSPSLAPDDDTVLWSKYIGDWVDSNPTLKDERLYIVGDNYHQQGGADLWCLNPFNGSVIWKTNIPDEFVWGSPTDANDRVYVLGTYFNLYCYDANTGDIKWTFPKYGHCSPMVVNDKVYFGSSGIFPNEGGIYCLNATTGEEIWVHDPITPYPCSTPAIVDGKVYIVNEFNLYCLNAETGAEIWNSPDKPSWASPTVFNNRVYTNAYGLYCLDAENGDELWNYPNDEWYCSPAIAYGNVYTGNSNGKVYCFDPETGDLNWDSISLGYMVNDVAVADDKVFIAVGGFEALSKLVCLDAYTGEVLWDGPFGGTYGTYSAPAIAYGNVYVGDGENGYIYAFGTPNEPPEIPSKPDGPTNGLTNIEYTFSTSTEDPEGDEVYYLFDWGDGSNSGWIGPYGSGTTVNASHIWTEVGDYEISVKAHDGRRESNWSNPLTIQIIEVNLPPDAPMITGETNGKKGTEYEYTFNAVDPDDHDVKYFIDWGDDNTEWTGYHTSGTDVKVKHTWSEKGTYSITSKAKDEFGVEGPEGTLEVTMPKNKAFDFNLNLLSWLFERFPNMFPILRNLLGLSILGGKK